MDNQENILGFPIAINDKKNCIDTILRWLKEDKRGRWLACANPHSIMVSRKDPLFAVALKNADLLVPDGIGIVLASRVLGGSISGRVTGTDIFQELSARLNSEGGWSYFFLGSTDQVLKKIECRMSNDYPAIKVVGTYSPPFKHEYSSEESDNIRRLINNSRPDVLWVGMTAPKQEKWILQNRDRLNVRFIGAVGAVFDYYSGNKKRANPVIQRLGLEWLPRFAREPGRLWKRNMVSSPLFLLHVFKERIFG